VETAAFLDYLDEHRATSGLGESVRDLLVFRRALAQRRALARQGALVPIPVPVDPPRQVRRAS
jgi:hypothetical protein